LPVAEHMRTVLAAPDDFVDQNPADHWPAQSLHGLTSEREQTHLARQEPIYYLQFAYCP
jgi:hypothetical protein